MSQDLEEAFVPSVYREKGGLDSYSMDSKIMSQKMHYTGLGGLPILRAVLTCQMVDGLVADIIILSGSLLDLLSNTVRCRLDWSKEEA